MAKRRGGSGAAKRFMAELPQRFLERVLPGAARAGATVIAEDAKDRLGGRRADAGGGAKVLIADSVVVRVRRKGTLVRARVMMDGPGAYVGRWLEYGTDPHFITVDDKARQGMTARRINNRLRDGDDALRATLLINGKPVGRSVYHPGATAHPFLRPALDTQETAAIAAAQSYITARGTRAGIAGAAGAEDA